MGAEGGCPSRMVTASVVEAGQVVWLAAEWRTIDEVTSDVERGGVRRTVLWCGRTGYRLALTSTVSVRSELPPRSDACAEPGPGTEGFRGPIGSAAASTVGPGCVPRVPVRPSALLGVC